jgi:hypothetical protein
MKRVLIPLAAAIVVAVMAVGIVLPVSAQEPTSLTLDLIIDGRETAQDVGDVVFTYDGEGQVSVVYNIDPATGWELVETHVYLDLSPPPKSAPGRFPYTAADTIALIPAAGDTVYIAAHAELQMVVVDPVTGETVIVTETGWAQSAELSNNPIPPGKNWATYVAVPVME